MNMKTLIRPEEDVVRSSESAVRGPLRGTIDDYIRYCRPRTGELLRAARLDMVYHRGEGDLLYYYDESGRERRVWDFLGGYGSLFFGHNHPELVDVAMESLRNQVPFSAQASCRGGAARLGEKLSQMMEARFGERFIATLANSGAEATEAAIKHAEIQQRKKFQVLEDRLRADLVRIRPALTMGQYTLNRESFGRLNEVFRTASGEDFESVIDAILSHNNRIIWQSPEFLALTGSFHGKTSGAVKLTYNPRYRRSFDRIGISVTFIPAFDAEELEKAIARKMLTLYSLEVRRNEVYCVEREVCNVAGLFVEPIQGEGGIHVAPADFLAECRSITERYHVPLIIDEIQTGMGRTGTWLYSEQAACLGDYFLLSKSLGGGLSKIAALLVREKHYNADFGFMHTSTFAEDDLSCFIATRALELIEENGGRLMQNCRRQGERLKSGLQVVQSRYPDVIKAVRGVGLLVGVELERQIDHGSVFIANFSRQELLGALVGSHLLHEYGIRVAPALSAGQVIRLEPSAFISDEAIDHCLQAFERICEIIHKQNMYELTRCLIGLSDPVDVEQVGQAREIENYRRDPLPPVPETGVRKVAFIGHLIQAGDIKLVDPSMSRYSDAECDRLLRKIFVVSGMIQYDFIEVRSVMGEKVLLCFLGLCVHSDIIIERMRAKDLSILEDKIMECVDFAIENKFTNIGFGGLSSIVMNNCKKVNRTNIGLTTGNSFTAAMGLEAMFQSAREKNIDLARATFAGIGANGNICSVYCKIMAEHVPHLILVGRAGREGALRDLAAEIYLEAIERIFIEVTANGLTFDRLAETLTGVASAIAGTRAVRALFAGEKVMQTFDVERARATVAALQDEPGVDLPVECTTDIKAIKRANLILGASSSLEPMITSEVLGAGPIVICDIALPQDTHDSVLERDDVSVMLGGIAKLPLNPNFVVPGIPVPIGNAYACMSETLLLGLHGMSENYSLGAITKTQVRKISEVARIHGFKLGQIKREKSF